MTSPALLGVIINPVAGLGGLVATHGSDGAAGVLAAERGGVSPAPQRMSRALAEMRTRLPGVRVLAGEGVMGGECARAAGFEVVEAARASTGRTEAADTRAAATEMMARGATLILFAGGDGTARDIVDVVGTYVPILGVPSGVKMHSAVFATTPVAAGTAAAAYLTDPTRSGTVTAEVVDRAGEEPSSGGPDVAVLGIARVPRERALLQSRKSGPVGDDEADLAALGAEIAAEMQPGRLYICGPGTTVNYVETALGLKGSVLGCDAVLDGRLICRDATEEELHQLVTEHPGAELILGVIGGQGFLLGRGNQQLSSRVLATVDAGRVQIMASAAKLAALDPPVLRVDLDDGNEAQRLTGYRRIRTKPRHSTVLRVVN